MDRKQKIQLIESYSPILWCLDDEPFLPEDSTNIVKKASLKKWNKDTKSGDVIRPTNTNKKFHAEYAQKMNKNEAYYLDLDDLNVKDSSIPAGTEIKRTGSHALAEYAGQEYSNNPFYRTCSRRTSFQYYATVFENVTVEFPKDTHDRGYKIYGELLSGVYTVIQYHFYFIFNDWWDRHEADWERVEIILKQGGGRSFVRYFCHGASWLCDFPQSEVRLSDWLARWQAREKRNWKNRSSGGKTDYPHGDAYVYTGLGKHPFVFLARGSHATYPTPGYTEWIVNIPASKADLIIGEDERALGQTCIIPEFLTGQNRQQIIARLKDLKITMKAEKFLEWEAPKLIEEEEWLKFQGYWGEIHTNKKGWDAWQMPAELRKYIHSKPGRYKYPLKKILSEDFDSSNRYREGGQLLTYTRNFHRIIR